MTEETIKQICYTKQEEYEKSIEFYNQALEQQANHPGFMLNIAISQFMLGNKGLAKQTYDEVVKIAPSFSGKLEYQHKNSDNSVSIEETLEALNNLVK